MKRIFLHTIIPSRYFLFIIGFLFSANLSFSQSDLCANATLPANVLTPALVCNPVAGNVTGSTYSAGEPVVCGTPAYDVWYSFVATTVSTTVTLTPSAGSAIIAPMIQVFSGTCGALVNINCNASPLTVNGMTAGNTYYIRIFSATGPAPATALLGAFTICLTNPAPPANDLCTGATLLTTSTVCSNIGGTLFNATSTAGIPGDCGAANAWEVWYRFVPSTIYPTITLSSIGANFTAASPRIQLLSGACGSMTSLACVNGIVLNTSTAVGGAGLTVGATYYIRIYHNSATMAGTNAAWVFNICVTEMSAAATAAPVVDYGKSYINTSKPTGGTVTPGDVLEIRATFVVKTNTAYGVMLTESVPANTTYQAGTLRILTNEGKIYKQWTDVTDGDAADIAGTNIRIGYGTNAKETAGGSVKSTDRPTNFGNTCIMVAAYRVVVVGAYGSIVNVGGGTLSFTSGTGTTTVIPFPAVNAVVYKNSGICVNTVGTNAIISEFGGTFGSGPTKDRVASNKVPSNYTYNPFATNQPQDYKYGVSNNTSAGTALANYSINPNDLTAAHRVFNIWDIMGDHTGAAVPTTGNLPADVNAGQSGGYMVVINAAYRTDTAFLDTIKNLCPNTSYEYSAWFKNICRKCAADSTGKSPNTVGYVPTGPGDSSGVHPTLSFNINGFDYYTTGDIMYTNQWIKKGFTYRTGPVETQMIISIRNNAPGGGGNDWAIDDIGVATCSPTLNVNPAAPVINVCFGDGLSLSALVNSFFDNYTYYVWERSIDNGVTWANTAFSGAGVVATFNGTDYDYTATGPSIIGDSTTAGNRFRLRVGSTSGNLVDPNCSFLAARQIQVLVENCSYVLKSDLLNASGSLRNNLATIQWQTVNENDKVVYEVERSADGRRFFTIGKLKATAGQGSRGEYTYNDTRIIAGSGYYRIKLVDGARFKYSKVILLTIGDIPFEVKGVVTPFTSDVSFEAMLPAEGMVNITVMDNYGRRIRSTAEKVVKGINNIKMINLSSISPGVYALQVEYKGTTIVKRILKVNK